MPALICKPDTVPLNPSQLHTLAPLILDSTGVREENQNVQMICDSPVYHDHNGPPQSFTLSPAAAEY